MRRVTGTSMGRARPCLQSASALSWCEGTRGSASRSVHNRARPRRGPLPPAPIPQWHPSVRSRRCAPSWTRCASTLSNTTRRVQEAQGRPHACDDALVARLVQGRTDQREDHGLVEHQRRGTTHAMVPAACGCTPPAAGSCGLWSRQAARRQAARLGKALGTAPRPLIA